MKRIFTILTLAFILATPQVKAQINFVNADFENWSSNTSASGWNTLGYMGFNLCEFSRTTDAYSGNFAASISSQMLPSLVSNMLGIPQIAIPGFMTNATIDFTQLISIFQGISNIGDGISLTDNLEMLNSLSNILTNGLNVDGYEVSAINGQFSFEPASSTEMGLLATILVNTENNSRSIVGGGVQEIIDATDGYQDFSIEMFSLGKAQELIFLALTTSMDTNAVEFGKLKLDNLSISANQVGLEEIEEDNSIVLYPNPAKQSFKIQCNTPKQVSICDAIGRTIKQFDNYTPNTTITLENKGIYFVKIDNSYKKLVIE